MSQSLPEADCSGQLAALRQAGAHLMEPVRFHYLEVLARRAQEQPPRVRQILQERLSQELLLWQQRHPEATRARAQAPLQTPLPAAPSPLAALRDCLARQPGGGAQTELKAVRESRQDWSRLSAQRQLRQAQEQAPRNAGPINSHLLVLRTLGLMGDRAPDYLRRFMSYVDTLLCLEQAGQTPPARPRKGGPARSRQGSAGN